MFSSIIKSLRANPDKWHQAFLCSLLGHTFTAALVYGGLNTSLREGMLAADFLLKWGAISLTLLAICCALPRPTWVVYLLSALTTASVCTFAVFKGLALSDNRYMEGMIWIPFAFVMYFAICNMSICGFHSIVIVLHSSKNAR
jgi:hypothetical protein